MAINLHHHAKTNSNYQFFTADKRNLINLPLFRNWKNKIIKHFTDQVDIFSFVYVRDTQYTFQNSATNFHIWTQSKQYILIQWKILLME